MQHLTNQGYSWTLIIRTFQLYTLVLLVPFFMNIYPLSPKSDQYQVSPCNNYECLVKQSGH